MFTDMPGETDVIQPRVKFTDDTPIQCKPNPLPYTTRKELQKVDSVLKIGVMRPSTSPDACPIIMVNKKDASKRVCVDFRNLNKITEVIRARDDG